MSISRKNYITNLFSITIVSLLLAAFYSIPVNAKTKTTTPSASLAAEAKKRLMGTWEGRMAIGIKKSNKYNYFRIVFLPNGQYQTFAETRQGKLRAHPKLIPSVSRGAYKVLASDDKTLRVNFTQSSGKRKVEILRFIARNAFVDASGITFQSK